MNNTIFPSANLLVTAIYVHVIGTTNSPTSISLSLSVCLFVFHHKKITNKFQMVEVLIRPRCAIGVSTTGVAT